MRTHFITAVPQERLPDAQQTMRLARLRHLLVVQEGQLVGVVSYRTLLESLLEGRADLQSVSDVMTAGPWTVNPTTPLVDAAERLWRYGLGCLPVVEPEGDRLVAVITESDLLRFAFRRGRRTPGRRGSNGKPA